MVWAGRSLARHRAAELDPVHVRVLEPDPARLCGAEQLAYRDIAFLRLSEPDWAGGPAVDEQCRRALRSVFAGVIVGAGGYTAEKAVTLIGEGLIDAVAFGRPFIANPDLPRRLVERLPLNEPVPRRSAAAGPRDAPTTPRPPADPRGTGCRMWGRGYLCGSLPPLAEEPL